MMRLKSSLAADPDVDRAISKIQKAIIQTKPAKKIRKDVENYIKKEIDPPAWTTTAIAIGFSAAQGGKISTDKFKNLRFKGESWELRPDVEYHFNGQTSGQVNFNLQF